MPVRVFYTSVSSSLETKKSQSKLFMILDGKKIQYESVDIAQDENAKHLMRELAGDQRALPPQICNGNNYCGDFTAFENAVEEETVEQFLKL